MNPELRRIDPLRAANVLGLVYGMLTGAFALLALPFFLFLGALSHETPGFAGPVVAFLMLVLYPVLGLVMGWIAGLIGAASYNLVARIVGGLRFELDTGAPAPAAEQP